MLAWQRRTVDGVEALVGDVDGPLAAALVLGVGQADETLVTRGRLHLLEHLVFPSQDVAVECSGRVDLTHTLFVVHGDDEVARGFLREVCGALAQPPVERLGVERRILGVEDDRPLLAGRELEALRLLFGARGAGLAAWPELGLRRVQAQDLRELASRWCVTGGARLVLSRPLEGVELGLPDGPPPALARSAVPLLRGPAEVTNAAPGAAMAAVVPSGPAAALLRCALERRAWEVLREQRGLAYDVSAKPMPLTAEESLLVVGCDARPADAGLAGDALLDVVDEAAEGRLPARHLAAAREEIAGHLSPGDPHEAVGLLTALATSELRGHPRRTPQEVHDRYAAVGADDIAAVARQVRDTLLLLLPADASSGRLPLVPGEPGEPVEGRRYGTRLVTKTLGAKEVVAGPDRLTAGDATVRFDALAAAVDGDAGALALVGLDGQEVHLDPGDLRDGASLLEEVRGRIPPELVVPADDRLRAIREASGGRELSSFAVADLPAEAAERLAPDEDVRHSAAALLGVRTALALVTDRRVLVVAKFMTVRVAEVPLQRIRTVRANRNPAWPRVRIAAHQADDLLVDFMTVSRARTFARAVDAAIAALDQRAR